MTVIQFTNLLEAEFDDLEPGTLKPDTDFRNLDEWSSLQALIIIALIDSEYDVALNDEDLSNISTIAELYELVKSKMV
jgi:acyl carrier protein